MGIQGARQHQSFHDRIGRIRKGGPNTMGTIYAGVDGGAGVYTGRRKRREVPMALMLPLALILGAGAMLAGRVGAFHLLADPAALPPEYADLIVLTADIGIAAVALLIVAMLFRLGKTPRLVAAMAGFLGVMLLEPLMIQQAPDLFAQVFSESYVTAAVAGIPEEPFSAAALGL